MSWSLQIKNGDLSVAGPSGFSVVSSTQKLIQDLRNHLLEERGSDPFHPEYGSTLDGGLMPDGSIIESSIGGSMSQERMLDIEAEIRRVLAAYQEQQLSRLRRESVSLGGKNTFAPGEILFSVDAVDVRQYADVILARIVIRTQSGQQLQIITPAS